MTTTGGIDRRLKTDGATQEELERIKKLNQRDFLERLRENEKLATTLATLEVQVGWGYLESYLERTAAVTAEDIQRVARKYLQPGMRNTVFVIPGGTPDKPAESYSESRSARAGDSEPGGRYPSI